MSSVVETCPTNSKSRRGNRIVEMMRVNAGSSWINHERKERELVLDISLFPFAKFNETSILLDLDHFRKGKQVKYLGTQEALERKTHVTLITIGHQVGTSHTYRIVGIEYVRKNVKLLLQR
ncbi:hypothetical protein [Vagococcus xieshaowenii]|uniref:Uncharacterized protein n=1 Tax=Vagococcus xieshaowenii TaxID=2562451 RepID=A0AAJ5EFM9_9ENTE|nr:hypothetical protein [Vagococcus xieshaowenii]QCA29673.1 hypothetical protein E4Z98_09815 [Vagococcus xieshaowenii]TFZ42948.1 hypothetical protein E4031_01555 [Vagococcus xieshaowenii]